MSQIQVKKCCEAFCQREAIREVYVPNGRLLVFCEDCYKAFRLRNYRMMRK